MSIILPEQLTSTSLLASRKLPGVSFGHFRLQLRSARSRPSGAGTGRGSSMLCRARSLSQRLPLRAVLRSRGALFPRQNPRRLSSSAGLHPLRSKLLLGSVLSSGAATGAVLTADRWESMLPEEARAVVRIMRLNMTVTAIVLHYAFAFATRNRDTEYDAQLAALQQAQAELEATFAKKPLSGTVAEMNEWEAGVQEARRRVDVASEVLANMEAEDKGGWLHDVHQRSAVRLRDMCAKNRGVYIKVGQHLAQMDYMIPVEYCEVLRSLLDQTPVSSFESVRRTIEEEFGMPLEEMFSQFDEVPIASASLAQVHIAYDRQGRKCAVKVQHEGLREGSEADRRAITLIVDRVEKLFSQFRYGWLTRQMNETLPLELDFLHEAQNAERLGEILKRSCGDDVIVPAVYHASPRALIMSWEDGVYVTDAQQMKADNISLAEVSRLINQAFCDQIYREGFVHCDPHEANVLVREHPRKKNGHPQVVLLDHGLYRELDDEFRTDYCRLWKAILLSDEANIKHYCRKMGVEEMYHLLAAMLTMRPWDDIASNDFEKMQAKGTSSDNAMLRAYAYKYFKHIAQVLTMVKPELLLLFKTNDCLRHIDRSLGAPFNNSILIAKTCNDVLLAEDLKQASSWGEIFQAYYSHCTVFTRISVFGLMAWLQQRWK